MLHFLKDFFIYGFVSILGKLAAVFLIPVYTSILTKEEYGAMALIVSCKGVIDLVSNLNIHSGIVRDYYDVGKDRTRLVSTGLFSILVLSCFTLLIVLLLSDFLVTDILYIPNFKSAFVLMALSIPVGSLMSYFSILARFKKRPLLYSIGCLVQLLVQILVSLIGVVYLKLGIPSIFFGVLAGEIISVIYFAFLNKSYISFSFNRDYLKRALCFAIPTLPAILAGWIDTSLGQIIVGRFIDVEELGVYSLALQLASVFTLVSAAFQNVWAPFLYEHYSKESFSSEASRLFSVITVILLCISITLSFFSKEIVLLLSNSNYENASIYVPILCIAMSFYMLFPFAISGIEVMRKTHYIGFGYVFGSILNILTIIVLIRYVGVLAAPISLSLSRIMSFVFMWRKSHKYLQFKCPSILLVAIVLCSVISFLCNYYSIGLLYRTICSVVLLLCTIISLLRNFAVCIRVRSKQNIGCN